MKYSKPMKKGRSTSRGSILIIITLRKRLCKKISQSGLDLMKQMLQKEVNKRFSSA
jgi:hypothetical protein